MKEYIKINPADNVAVAITPLTKGTVIEIDGKTITLGHRIFLQGIKLPCRISLRARMSSSTVSPSVMCFMT